MNSGYHDKKSELSKIVLKLNLKKIFLHTGCHNINGNAMTTSIISTFLHAGLLRKLSFVVYAVKTFNTEN